MSDETPVLTSAPPAPEAPESTNQQAQKQDAAQAPERKGSRMLPLLVVGLLLAFAAIGWVWQQGKQTVDGLRHEVAGRVSEGDEIAREARASARQGQDAIADLQRRLARTEADLAEARGQQAAIEALYESLARNREDQLLVEIEQAVGLAMQQLQLAGNVEAALAALRAAEARLAKADAAPLVRLRKAMLSDIELLAASPRLDVTGTAARLEVLVSAIDRMPLALVAPPPKLEVGDAPLPGGVPEKVKRFAGELWQELSSLVRIERLDGAHPAFLSPKDEFFLRENLRLRMLSARLSVLAGDDRSYQTDLQQASEWIKHFFDTKSPVVDNGLAQIAELARIHLGTDQIPMLQHTYAELRALQQRAPAIATGTESKAPTASPPHQADGQEAPLQPSAPASAEAGTTGAAAHGEEMPAAGAAAAATAAGSHEEQAPKEEAPEEAAGEQAPKEEAAEVKATASEGEHAPAGDAASDSSSTDSPPAEAPASAH